MDYSFFESIYKDFGIHAIISMILICILRLILRKYCGEKLSRITISYFEIIFAVLFELVFTLIYFKSLESFSIKSITSAFISYSGSLAVYSLIKKIASGKSIKQDSKILLIETLIEDYISDDKKSDVAGEILIIVNKKDFVKDELCAYINDNLSRPCDLEQITALTELIIDSTKNFK
ncbi:MAG: hypothetical protein IJW43_01905 [Clostridia bacterium]|nr:hypothetical protein [Clostridia bacterium]